MNPEEWDTSGEPAARGSLLGWAVFLVLVASLLVLEVTVGFFGGTPLFAHDVGALLAPVAGGLLAGAAYVVAWRWERFRPPHTANGAVATGAVLVFFAVFFGLIGAGLASPVQLWLAVTSVVAVVVTGRAVAVSRARS